MRGAGQGWHGAKRREGGEERSACLSPPISKSSCLTRPRPQHTCSLSLGDVMAWQREMADEISLTRKARLHEQRHRRECGSMCSGREQEFFPMLFPACLPACLPA